MQTVQKRAFVWVQQTGEPIAVTNMRTTHIFYSLRMIFNHLVPRAFQIPGCKRYSGIARWPKSQLRGAVLAFVEELANRPKHDLQGWQWAELLYIVETSQRLSLLEIEEN